MQFFSRDIDKLILIQKIIKQPTKLTGTVKVMRFTQKHVTLYMQVI